jgi:hypothetical protein
MNRKRLLASLVLLLLIGIGLATHVHPLDSTPPIQVHTTVEAEAPTLRQDAEVVAVMQRLGLDYSTLNLVYGDNPQMYTASTASFVAPNTLYISQSVDQSKLSIIVSHEYIHYIQSKDVAGSKSIYPYLDGLQQSNTWLSNRMKPYHTSICNGACDLNMEAEAIACTEMPDSALQSDFIAWCNKYLPQRYSLF